MIKDILTGGYPMYKYTSIKKESVSLPSLLAKSETTTIAIRPKDCHLLLITKLKTCLNAIKTIEDYHKQRSTLNFLLQNLPTTLIIKHDLKDIQNLNDTILNEQASQLFTDLKTLSLTEENSDGCESLIKKHPILVFSTDDYNFTPLHVAIAHGHTDIAKTLLETGADIEARIRDPESSGFTPLHVGIIHGQEDCVELLIDMKANTNARTQEGYFALHIAIEMGNSTVISALLNTDIDLSSTDIAGNSVLHIAVSKEDTDIIEDLFLAGATIETTNNLSHTPLHEAIFSEDIDVIKCLLRLGANKEAQTWDRKTSQEIARERGNPEIMRLLGINPTKQKAALSVMSGSSKKQKP